MSKAKLMAGCLLLLVAAFSGCRQDMHDNPKYKPYREGGMREYPVGVVARGSLAANPAAPPMEAGTAQQVQTVTAAIQLAGGLTASPTPVPIPKGEDAFPFKLSKEILDRGEERFNIYCSHCHGKTGQGDGMIVLRGFKRPPAYSDDRLRQAPASHFYDVMTNGFGAMQDYAAQVPVADRWAIAAYIRALQLSQRATVDDVPQNRRADLDRPAPTGAAPEGR